MTLKNVHFNLKQKRNWRVRVLARLRNSFRIRKGTMKWNNRTFKDYKRMKWKLSVLSIEHSKPVNEYLTEDKKMKMINRKCMKGCMIGPKVLSRLCNKKPNHLNEAILMLIDCIDKLLRGRINQVRSFLQVTS